MGHLQHLAEQLDRHGQAHPRSRPRGRRPRPQPEQQHRHGRHGERRGNVTFDCHGSVGSATSATKAMHG
jgi:hypothetical protein